MSPTTKPHEYDFSNKAAAPGISNQEFLVFKVGEKEYAIHPVRVEGLRGCQNIIWLRDAPEFLAGVIHYNGLIAPVIDLRLQFDPGTRVHDASMNVLMLNIADRIVGMVVKSVSGILELSDEQITPVAEMMHSTDVDYLIGIARLNERKIHLVNSARLMSRIMTWLHLEKAVA